MFLDHFLGWEGINGLQHSVPSLINSGVRPGLGQTLEEVADVGLDGLLGGAVVNLLVNRGLDVGDLVQNCLDMTLQSGQVIYNRI